MGGHPFSFEGGDELSTIAAWWLVSYSYYLHVDRTHKKWEQIQTWPNRMSTFKRTVSYHKFWLQQVLKMNDNKLATNSVKLPPEEIKRMAQAVLNKMQDEENCKTRI